MAKKRKNQEIFYDEAKIKAEEDKAFEAYLKKKAEEEEKAKTKTIEEIESYFGDDELAEEEFPKKDKGKRSEKMRLDRKNRKKRENPHLKKP